MEDQRTSPIPPWLQRLGSRIRLARRARGLTQTDAAGPGLTKSFVSLLESGRTYPSVGTLVTMADRLQTSLGQLLLDRPQLARETALNLVMLARESPPNGAVGLLLDAAETLAGDSDDLQVELRLTRGDVAASQDRPKDADRWFREALTQALEVEGYRVSIAVNGWDAWEKLHSGLSPALVLLALMMPIMNGAEFLAALRTDATLHDLPVILVSAFDSVAAAHSHQSQCYLAKPVDLDTLIETVARFCSPQPR